MITAIKGNVVTMELWINDIHVSDCFFKSASEIFYVWFWNETFDKSRDWKLAHSLMAAHIRCALFLGWGQFASVSLFASCCCQNQLIDTNWCSAGLCSRRCHPPAPRSSPVTNAASKLLWQAAILQDPSCCVWAFKFLSLTPGAPPILPPSVIIGQSCTSHGERRFGFPLCLNHVQIGRKCMTDNLCPTCSYTTQARTSYRKRHIELKSQKTTHFGKNRAEGQFWICLWLSLTNLRARSSWVV